MSALELSVVVPTYNRRENLEAVLPTLLEQSLPANAYEIIIADSMSTDGTAGYARDVVAKSGERVRYLPGRYAGRAAARNAGIASARAPLVFFTDADILASPTLLERHAAEHARAQARVAVVGCELQVRSLEDYAAQRDHPALRKPLHPATRRTLSWLYFLTGNASVRRDDLLAVGCFDERFTGYGHEDLELGYRLQKAGITILYEPRAVNYHCQDVPHGDQVEKMKLAGRSTVRFYRKHPDLAVMANLGMTPVSLGLHSALTRLPAVLGFFDRRAASSKFARDVVQQYYYVSGIKTALAEDKHA